MPTSTDLPRQHVAGLSQAAFHRLTTQQIASASFPEDYRPFHRSGKQICLKRDGKFVCTMIAV